MDLNEWSKIGLAFAVGVSLSAGYVALGERPAETPSVVVVEERCADAPEADAAPTPAATPDPLGLTRDPPYYGMSRAELEAMASKCDLRDDDPRTLDDELAAALGLSEAEREAWMRALDRMQGERAAMHFTMLRELAPELDSSTLEPAFRTLEISSRVEATKRLEDRSVRRHIAQERAGLREPPSSAALLARASAWQRWERWRLSKGDRFAELLTRDLGAARVDELRRKFGGWPGGGTRHTGCEDEPDSDGFSVEGGLDKDTIRRIVRAHIPEIRSCYERGLKDDPKLAGTVVVEFTIDAGGDVAATSADSDLGHRKTELCMLEAVERWRFPKPRWGTSVNISYPFKLSPG